MSTLADFVEGLPPEKKSILVNTFFRIWSSNGFGTMTKKDTELLLFRCLADLLSSDAPDNNYKWAHLLRVTPQKVKAIRLESHLRFGHLFPASTEVGPAKYFGELQTLQLQLRSDGSEDFLKDVTVSFVLEDPVAQMELENNLKEVGTYLDFHRNREVVELRFVDFLKIIREHATDLDEKAAIEGILQAKLKDAKQLESLESRLKSREYANKAESEKLLAFIELLGETFAEKPIALLKHLGLILKSQKER